MTRRHRSVAVVLGLCVALSACRTTDPTSARADARLDGASIFALDVALVDQDGARIRLADLAGRPMILAMGYTSCRSICPSVIEEMKAVEHSLGTREPDVRFVMLTLDPARDSPQALRRFGSERHLDSTRWRLLTASEDDVRDLAAVLGVRYAPAPSNEIVHSSLVLAIDRRGVVRHRQVGVGQDLKPLFEAISAQH